MFATAACTKRGGCVRRPQDTFVTPCMDVGWNLLVHASALRPVTVRAAGHHTDQDRAVLVIVKPRRGRSDRAFRTASGLTTPPRGADVRQLRDGRSTPTVEAVQADANG
jgi:hypothetical protein